MGLDYTEAHLPSNCFSHAILSLPVKSGSLNTLRARLRACKGQLSLKSEHKLKGFTMDLPINCPDCGSKWTRNKYDLERNPDYPNDRICEDCGAHYRESNSKIIVISGNSRETTREYLQDCQYNRYNIE